MDEALLRTLESTHRAFHAMAVPHQRHSGEDMGILRQRHELYDVSRRRHPARWSGDTRSWGHIR